MPKSWNGCCAAALAIAALLGFAPSAAGQGRTVDLLLVLAIDCSYSVDYDEYDLQRQGIAQALVDPEIREAIGTGPNGAIAIAIVQWSSERSQVLALPWTLLDGSRAAEAAAARISTLQRTTQDGATSISQAIAYSVGVLNNSPYRAVRRIIDISGDGRNNNGRPVEPFREAAAAQGITINGLSILNEEPTLDYYFRQRIIAGFGAFVMPANGYDDYRDAIRRKMLKEIRYVPVSQDTASPPDRG